MTEEEKKTKKHQNKDKKKVKGSLTFWRSEEKGPLQEAKLHKGVNCERLKLPGWKEDKQRKQHWISLLRVRATLPERSQMQKRLLS